MIEILILLVVVGVVLWLVETMIPMDPAIRQVIRVFVVLVVVIWLLRLFGVLDGSLG